MTTKGRLQPDPARAPAQARARMLLLSLIDARELGPGGRLPSLRELAREAGTTYVSMQKAVRGLVQQGVLTAKPRAGIHVVTRPPRPGSVAGATYVRQRVQGKMGACGSIQQAIRRDILGGRFPFGIPLPLLKELSQRYGGCTVTLRKALDGLVGEGLLEPFGRGYRSGGVTRLSGHNVVALLVPPYGTPMATSIATISQTVHLEAAAAGVQIYTIEFNGHRYDADDCRRLVRRIDERGIRSRLLGVIGCNVTGRRSSFDDLHPHLRSLQVPVALADDTGEAPYATADVYRELLWFSAGSTQRCGERVGRYVVETGHRSVAFIMIDPNTPAMESRFDGVERAVTAAGASLHRVVPRAGVNRAGLRGPLWDKAWPPIRNLFTSGSLRRALPVHVASVFERACNRALFSSLDAYATEVLLRPVLTQAMRELDATVWIAENDPTAVACLRFLRERNVAVPGEVALVGFDDSPEAAGNDLTSYNFNAPAIARAMLQFVLHPGQARRPHSPVDIDGFVVERGSAPRSSGPAAGDSVSARAPARATRRSRRRR